MSEAHGPTGQREPVVARTSRISANAWKKLTTLLTLLVVAVAIGLPLTVAFFGPGTGCTNDPTCTSGAMGCNTCAWVRVGFNTWVVGEVTLVAGLVGWLFLGRPRQYMVLGTYVLGTITLIVVGMFIALQWHHASGVVPT